MKSSDLFTLEEAVTDMPEGSDLNDQLTILVGKLEACKRALGIANRLETPEERKKYRSRIMGFMNQLRPMFNRVAKTLEAEIAAGK
jgi:hypothetical protein